MPLDEKQCRSGLVVGVEMRQIRPVPDVPGGRNNLRRFWSCHPGLERIVTVPNWDVVAVEISRREGDGYGRICCHRGVGLRRDCPSGGGGGAERGNERVLWGALPLFHLPPHYGVDRGSGACGTLK